ncbi:hypothetical protein TWF102_008079 [Orbilia oligospora]|uniref:Uncharacterized protein n=1 Tax=Orbilia oligospora TaxID=2813651 RepID=A0A7C8JI18_ORBOL|nr:hypothetical protein TWF706_009816 [Orbilia oligospora]KAF3091846.1 hypothetical protein TWF103_011408 [Orbilia oligospora]KAF3110502.1 hypothetical protein TWF102_008079 [Orbilia oligospora]
MPQTVFSAQGSPHIQRHKRSDSDLQLMPQIIHLDHEDQISDSIPGGFYEEQQTGLTATPTPLGKSVYKTTLILKHRHSEIFQYSNPLVHEKSTAITSRDRLDSVFSTSQAQETSISGDRSLIGRQPDASDWRNGAFNAVMEYLDTNGSTIID